MTEISFNVMMKALNQAKASYLQSKSLYDMWMEAIPRCPNCGWKTNETVCPACGWDSVNETW